MILLGTLRLFILYFYLSSYNFTEHFLVILIGFVQLISLFSIFYNKA